MVGKLGLAVLARHCAAVLRGAGLKLTEPVGAFYLFPDFCPFRKPLRAHGVRTSSALSERLLQETGVATIPGESFGRPPDELTVRMAYVDFDGRAALDAVGALSRDAPLDEAFLRARCPRVMEAMDRVADWLRAMGDIAAAPDPQETKETT